MEHKSGGRLCGMRGNIRTQSGDPEVWAVVDKSVVLQSSRDVTRESVIHTATVNKCRACLPLRPEKSYAIASRIEHQSARSSQHVGPHPRDIDGNVNN